MAKTVKYRGTPTAKKVFADNNDYICIRGPVGSGKSVQCIMKLLRLARNQEPDNNGIRRTKWGVVRSTYPELISTTIATFKDWVDDSVCHITYGSPIRGTLKGKLKDGTRLEAEFIFLALNRPDDMKKLKSFEFTGLWINEAVFIPWEIVNEAYSRAGRFPPMKDGVGATWSGVIMDTNSPDDSNWWYNVEQNLTLPNWSFFIQPGALLEISKRKLDPILKDWVRICKENGWYKEVTKVKDDVSVTRIYIANPDAENVENHVKGYRYWLDQIDASKDENWINAQILNEYALVRSGKPVYEEQFNQALHIVSEPYGYAKRFNIVVGMDFGRTPSAIIGQLMPSGQLRILHEIVSQGMGVKQFAKALLIPFLEKHFPDIEIKNIPIFGDPSGEDQRSEVEETTAIGALISLGFKRAQPSPDKSNNIKNRQEGVHHYLLGSNGNIPLFALNPNCLILKKGFVSGYAFKRLNVAGSAQYSEKPDKNEYSHPHDALQYLCLGAMSIGHELMQSFYAPQHTMNINTDSQVANSNTGY